MDGFDFLAEYKKSFPDKLEGTQIFMLSSSELATDRQKVLSYDFVVDFLNMPLTRSELLKIFE